MAVGHRRRRPPAGYDAAAYPPFAVTVDVVVLTIRERQLQVLLVERGEEPYEGWYALPGGFVRADESLDDAAARELREETGVDAAAHLEQIGAFGDPDRDPRMRVVTVAYLAVLGSIGTTMAGTDARNVELVPVSTLLTRRPKRKLAFDHREVLQRAVEHARTKLEYTSLATAFVGPEFTMSDLRGVYEAAWGVELDPGNFRRKMLEHNPGIVERTGRRSAVGPEGGKPAETFVAASRVAPLPSPVRRPPSDDEEY